MRLVTVVDDLAILDSPMVRDISIPFSLLLGRNLTRIGRRR
jgi:hypothetical protein